MSGKDKADNVTSLPPPGSRGILKKMIGEARDDKEKERRRRLTEAEKLTQGSEDFFRRSGEIFQQRMEELEAPSPALPDIQTDARADRQTDRQTHEQTGRRADSHAESLADRHSDAHSDALSDRQAGEQADELTDALFDEQADARPDTQYPEIHPDEFYWISDRQARILICLIKEPSRIISYSELAKRSGIPYGTCRGSVAVLLQRGYLTSRSPYRHGMFQGIKYSINSPLCRRFLASRGDLFLGDVQTYSDARANRQTGRQADAHKVYQTGNHAFPSSSSRDSLESTTREELRTALERDPELKWWQGPGLTVAQVEGWLKELQMDVEVMLESLRHGAADPKVREADKPLNYLYTVLRSAHYYPPPPGYKSHRQKQRELAEQIRQRRQQEEAEALEDQVEIILAHQESDLYRRCWELVPEKDRRLIKEPGGPMHRTAIKKAWRQLRETEGEGALDELLNG